MLSVNMNSSLLLRDLIEGVNFMLGKIDNMCCYIIETALKYYSVVMLNESLCSVG